MEAEDQEGVNICVPVSVWLVGYPSTRPKICKSVHVSEITTTVLDLVKWVFPMLGPGFRNNVYVWRPDRNNHHLYNPGSLLGLDRNVWDTLYHDRTGSHSEIHMLASSLFLSGLPPLAHCCNVSTSTCTTGPDTHEPVEFIESTFNRLESDYIWDRKLMESRNLDVVLQCQWDSNHIEDSSLLLTRSKPDQGLQWSSEDTIKEYVSNVLQDITNEAGLADITCHKGMCLYEDTKPDITIVNKFGFPIGVVQVKRPDALTNCERIMSDKKILGQLFVYVDQLRKYGGRECAFGILSTYEEWRIVWLDNELGTCTSMAQATKLPSPDDVHGDRTAAVLSSRLPKQLPDYSGPSSNHFHLIDITSTLSVSQVYKYDDNILPTVLLSLLRKMNSSRMIPQLPVKNLCIGQVYVELMTDKTRTATEHNCAPHPSFMWKWSKPPSNKDLKVESKAPSSFKSGIYLLADLDGNQEVWLATTPRGKVCVLKFASNGTNMQQEVVSENVTVWQKAWSIITIVKEIMGKSVFIMPWTRPCTKAELQDDQCIKGAIHTAIKDLAKAKYKYDTEHLSKHKEKSIGLYKEGDRVRAVLLGSKFEKLANEQQQELAINDMLIAIGLEQLINPPHPGSIESPADRDELSQSLNRSEDDDNLSTK